MLIASICEGPSSHSNDLASHPQSVPESLGATTQRQRPLAHSAATVGHSIGLLPPHPAAPVVDEAIAHVGGRKTLPPIHSFPQLYLQFAVTVYLYSICKSTKNTNQTAGWSAFCVAFREREIAANRTSRTALPSMSNAFQPRKQKAHRNRRTWVYVGHSERENRA